MLSIKSQEALLKALKVPEEKLPEYLGEAETEFELPELHIFDNTGIEELKGNLKKGFTESWTEIQAKQLNEKHKLGLTGKDAKNLEKVYEAMQAKAAKDANANPDEKVTKLTQDLDTLRSNITEKESEVLTWKEKYENLLINEEYRKLLIPERNDALDETEWIERLKRNIGWKKEGDTVIYFNKTTGKDYTDSKLTPLSFDEVKEKLWNDNKGWKKEASAAPAADPVDPRKTHNPALGQRRDTRKYDHDTAMKEVDKKYPPGSKIPNLAKLRQQHYQQLMTQ